MPSCPSSHRGNSLPTTGASTGKSAFPLPTQFTQINHELLNPIQLEARAARPTPPSNRAADDLTTLSITITSSLGSTPCFHSLKINPVSGSHLLGVWLRDGYFEPWLLKDDLLGRGGLQAFNAAPPLTRQITHERESPFSWHTRNCITPAGQMEKWRTYERQTQALLNYGRQSIDFCQPVWDCSPCGGICLHSLYITIKL